MAYEKKTWRTDLAGIPVNWGCYNPETLDPNASDINGPWARMVVLSAIAPDGRRLEMVLTPTLAREYARQIVRVADSMDSINRTHGNGFAPDYEEPAATLERPSFEQLMDTAHHGPSSDRRLMGQQEVAAFLGVSRARVADLIKKKTDFPQPLARLACGPIWLAQDIEAFESAWERRPGRPPKLREGEGSE